MSSMSSPVRRGRRPTDSRVRPLTRTPPGTPPSAVGVTTTRTRPRKPLTPATGTWAGDTAAITRTRRFASTPPPRRSPPSTRPARAPGPVGPSAPSPRSPTWWWATARPPPTRRRAAPAPREAASPAATAAVASPGPVPPRASEPGRPGSCLRCLCPAPGSPGPRYYRY